MVCSASLLTLAVAPLATQAAESAPASAVLTIEPSVGASLSGGLSQGLFVAIFLPGTPGRSRPVAMPGMVLSFEGTEVVADSAVSLRVEHRAATSTPPGFAGEEAEAGALLILAQFN